MDETAPAAADDRVFDAILLSARARTADLQRAHDATASGGNLGCLTMLASIAIGIGAVTMAVGGMTSAIGGSQILLVFLVVAVMLGVAVIVWRIGWRKWSPWSGANAALQSGTDDALIRPFVQHLAPGATFSRPLVTSSGYHPSLLLARVEGAAAQQHSTVEGSIAGLPAVLEEVHGSFDADIHQGWLLRFELPFAIDGHLRIRAPKSVDEFKRWVDGFEVVEDATARLGTRHTIDVAPLGVGMDSPPSLPAGGLHPDVLLTEALFERLRVSGDIDVAATGRTLWLFVPRNIRALDSQAGIPPDINSWHRLTRTWHDAVRTIREIEGIVTALVAPLATRR
ncbi:MAG: hypothetical protein ABW221_23415 [Vicinamibacteria bacterium]